MCIGDAFSVFWILTNKLIAATLDVKSPHPLSLSIPQQQWFRAKSPLKFSWVKNWFFLAKSAKLNTDEPFLWLAQNILVQQLNHATTYPTSSACQVSTSWNHTISHLFAELIRLSTTAHNLLTFNTRQISSNNSEKLSLLADKHRLTFLLHSPYSSSLMYGHMVGRPA